MKVVIQVTIVLYAQIVVKITKRLIHEIMKNKEEIHYLDVMDNDGWMSNDVICS